MIDLLLLVVIAIVTYCVASEGAWGAATTFIATILAGLLAMNFFESAAGMFPATVEWQARADIISLLGLFALAVTGLRMGAERLMPVQLEVPAMVYDAARWGFGVLTGYVTAAIVLTALHTAPLEREFLGFKAERNNLFDLGGPSNGPDRQWLAFTQYASENIFSTGNVFDRSAFERYRGKPVEYWSSFPIRYAFRRQQYASGGVSSPSGAPASAAPPPTPVSIPRPGGSGSAF